MLLLHRRDVLGDLDHIADGCVRNAHLEAACDVHLDDEQSGGCLGGNGSVMHAAWR